MEQFKTKYDYYEGVIEEVTKTSDKSFNQLLLLTVNSQLPKDEQVKRINESFAEKNKKILQYVSQLLLKNLAELLSLLGHFVLNLRSCDQKSFIDQFHQLAEKLSQNKEFDLKEVVLLTKQVGDLVKDK